MILAHQAAARTDRSAGDDHPASGCAAHGMALLDPGEHDRLLAVVVRMCRKFAREPADVDDAAQEVLLRYVQHRSTLAGPTEPWLATVARTVCSDIARWRRRERLRRGEWAVRARAQGDGAAERDRDAALLDLALLSLPAGDRSLIEKRCFERIPVKSLARELGVSPSTASRRVQAAMQRLGTVIESLEGAASSAAGNGAPAPPPAAPPAAPARRERASRRAERSGPTPTLRVGCLVSYESMRTPTDEGWHIGVEGQVRSLPLLHREGLELIALVEPDSLGVGGIERTVREYGLLGGVIDVTDAAAMYAELDVIYLGTTIAVLPRALDAILRAVQMGVGLFNEHFTGTNIPGIHDPRVLRLMLAERAAEHHTPGRHGQPRPAEVVEGHAIIPGMAVGTPLTVEGCGPIVVPARDSRVLIQRSDRPEPTHHVHRLPTGGVMPVLSAGRIDGGRVIVLNQFIPEIIAHHPDYRGDFFRNCCAWLARADEPASWWAGDERPGA